MTTTLSLSEVKAHFSELAEEVDRTHERIQVTKNGRDYVVVLSAADLESIEATLELLSDPAAQERVHRAQRELGRGEYVTAEEMDSIMAGRRDHPSDQ